MHAYAPRFAPLVLVAIMVLSSCSESEDPTKSGVLYVAAGTRESSAFAGFLGEGYGAQRCESALVDRCYVTTCLDGGPVQTYVDGGEVEFKGDEFDATLDTGAVEDPQGNAGPGLASAEGLPVLRDEEVVTVTLRGKGSVPEFETSFELPPRLTLETPELEEPACQGVDPDDVTPISVDVSDDFRVSWSSERDDDIDVLFMFDDIKDWPEDSDRQRSTTIRCLYTADEGEAVIPEEVVELMPIGRGTFSIRQIVSQAEFLEHWTLTFGAYWELCSPVEVE